MGVLFALGGLFVIDRFGAGWYNIVKICGIDGTITKVYTKITGCVLMFAAITLVQLSDAKKDAAAKQRTLSPE